MAGRLTIHGQGTAVFIASVNGQEVLLRIHNCPHSFGQFNLISVSQLKMVSGNSVNFSVENPFFEIFSEPIAGGGCLTSRCFRDSSHHGRRIVFCVTRTHTANDPRFYSLPVFDVTLPGDFVPVTHIFSAMTESDDDIPPPLWTTEILSPSSSMGRVLALNA